MNDKQQLLNEYSEWIGKVKEFGVLDEDYWNSPIADGKWTVRDVVCHIMRWDEYFFNEAIAKISTGDALTVRHLDYDAFNEEAKQYAKTLSTEALVDRTITAREQLIRTIEALPETKYEERYADGDGHPFEVAQFMRDFIWHDNHHLAQLNQVLQVG
ncbi:DinB family protein [Paenibacillus sp. JNUCC32]|uniref:DinB family protein n=1 Tax=Paenibacillus sp. JNUCC32 TaxID=2777984 RepID=UPI0017882F63|nr:DinB family protein [Paenibacillus sp. JNUCC-32]QOT11563.1 DinB family protein [Paenibacillus sp. JNUCC-32]